MKTKTGKKLLSTILALVMLLGTGTGTLCFSSFAADGETVTDGDITYVISNGCITDVTVKDDAVLENYTVPAKVDNISINSVGDAAFLGTKITTLTIPETVTSIGGGAFSFCNLSKVIFNASSCKISKYKNSYNQLYLEQNPAFFGNASLTEFEFGSKVGSIPAYACTNIYSLETVKFNKTVSEIGEAAFYGCSALKNIDLSNLTEIGAAAFNGCNSLDIIDLPKVKNIGAEAFMSCGSPSKVSFPKAATIGDCAFAKTNMVTLTIPETVTSIGGGAFSFCNLSKVIFNASSCKISKYKNSYNQLYLEQNPAFFGNASLTEFEFGSKVGSIPAYACTNIYSLETVKFNKTVSEIGEAAFYGCSALKNIDLSNLTEIGAAAFNGCNSLDIIDLPKVKNIGAEAFMSCGSPSKVSFPKAATIGDCAFAKTNMVTLTIPETVTSIGGGAFRNCNLLETVYFDACNIEEKNMPHYTSGYEVSHLNQSPIFYNDSSLTKVVFGEKVTKIPAYSCTNVYALEKVVFKAAVTEIGKNAFYNCQTPDEVTYAGTEAQWNTLKENSEGTGNESLFKCTNIKFNTIPVTEDVVTFKDQTSDVQVTDKNNAFGGKDVKLNVEVTSSDAELDKKINDFALTKVSEIYNISFTYNGKEIQPEGMVKVRIPYDKQVKDPSKIKVFHYHENANGEMTCSKISNITVVPGYIEFETDSFSKFVVTEDITVTINGNGKMQYKSTQTLNVEANGEVEFVSSNSKVVSVDKTTGKVTATGKGTATITATVKGTDVSSSINITVSYAWWQWLIKIVLFGWIWY